MASAIMIAVGYIGLITCFGWWGCAFACAHVGVLMLSFIRRR